MAWLQFRTLEHAAGARAAQIDPKRQIFSIERHSTGEKTFVVGRADEIEQLANSGATHLGGVAIDPINDKCTQYVDMSTRKTLFIVLNYTHKHNLQMIADVMSGIFQEAVQKILKSISSYNPCYALYATVGYFFYDGLPSTIRHQVWMAIKEKINEMVLNQDPRVHALLNFDLKDDLLFCSTIVDNNHFPPPEEPYLRILVPFSSCIVTNMKDLSDINEENSSASSSSSSSTQELVAKKRRMRDPVPQHECADDDTKDASTLQVLGAQLMQRIDTKWAMRPSAVKIPHNPKNTYAARSTQTHIITATANFWCPIGLCYHDSASAYIVLMLDPHSCSYKVKCHTCGTKFNHLVGKMGEYQPVPEDIAIKLRAYKTKSELSF